MKQQSYKKINGYNIHYAVHTLSSMREQIKETAQFNKYIMMENGASHL
jgi:hypothetical protein